MNSNEIVRVKRRFKNKFAKNRKPLYMIAKEDLRSVRILGAETIHITTLPEGVHEVRIISHPEHDKRGRGSNWIVTVQGNHLVGAAKTYLVNLSKNGIVEFYRGKRLG